MRDLAAGRDGWNDGFGVRSPREGRAPPGKLKTLSPALIVVDTLVADGDRIGFVRDLRKRSDMAIIVRDRDAEHVHGVQAFQAGADDCVGEGCSCEEVALRVHAILGRSRGDRVVASTSIQR